MSAAKRLRSNSNVPIEALTTMSEEDVAGILGQSCLSSMRTNSANFVAATLSIKDNLKVFGLKTSHILRAALMALFAAANLSLEAQLWVYLFCSLSKTKPRILSGIARLPAAIKESAPVTAATLFIREKMVSWPNEETDTKFATVHLPATNPGLSTLLWSLAQSGEDVMMPTSLLFKLTWFAQLHLSEEVLVMVKPHQMEFWNSVVKSSRSSKTPPGFKEDIWKNQVSDKYPLATFVKKVNQGEELMVVSYIKPASSDGFTIGELKGWWENLMDVLYNRRPETSREVDITMGEPEPPGEPIEAGGRILGPDALDPSPQVTPRADLTRLFDEESG